jgi:hypothetical protein
MVDRKQVELSDVLRGMKILESLGSTYMTLFCGLFPYLSVGTVTSLGTAELEELRSLGWWQGGCGIWYNNLGTKDDRTTA